MFKVTTDYPIAFDSPDHLYPHGTKNDNHTNTNFILEFMEWYKKHNNDLLTVMDVGCSGGALVNEWSGHTPYAIGLEGSDYSANTGRAHWPDLHNCGPGYKKLFTCDISREFKVNYGDYDYKCDLITAWEVIEHIPPDRLNVFFKNIWNHLKEGGVFLGSGASVSDAPQGVELHLSAFPKEKWDNEIIPRDNFDIIKYPLTSVVRTGCSFYFCVIRTSKNIFIGE